MSVRHMEGIIITSRVSERGNIFGSVRLCVCIIMTHHVSPAYGKVL